MHATQTGRVAPATQYMVRAVADGLDVFGPFDTRAEAERWSAGASEYYELDTEVAPIGGSAAPVSAARMPSVVPAAGPAQHIENVRCIRHPKYDGQSSPVISCTACCRLFVDAIKARSAAGGSK